MKRLFAAALLCAAVLAPSLADARGHHRAHRLPHGLPYPVSFWHNYGPGLALGSFAYYDGPATIFCRRSAAAYIGQDRRRHPCY
jgi:hypothetical protein